MNHNVRWLNDCYCIAHDLWNSIERLQLFFLVLDLATESVLNIQMVWWWAKRIERKKNGHESKYKWQHTHTHTRSRTQYTHTKTRQIKLFCHHIRSQSRHLFTKYRNWKRFIYIKIGLCLFRHAEERKKTTLGMELSRQRHGHGPYTQIVWIYEWDCLDGRARSRATSNTI